MTTRADIRVELCSNPQFFSGVRELIGSVARRTGFTEKNASQISLAVDEALCNILCHGYDRKTDRPITIGITPVREDNGGIGLTIVIEDEARQVDPSAIKGRDLADIRPGGLGVHIIREVMDAATYEKRDGGGMRLTLVKKQSQPACNGDSKTSSGCCSLKNAAQGGDCHG